MNKPPTYDMTFCISKCNNKKCIRNFKYLYKPHSIPYYSQAYFKNTRHCPEYKENENDTKG